MQMTRRVRTATATPSMDVNKHLFLLINLVFLAMALMVWSGTAAAQVARVLDIKGTALVERSGQVPRLLGAGEQLGERDVINVARDSWAILEFNDQTRITLRPNTVFRLDSYRADAPETMLLGLVKGGLRVVTGLFGKRNPQGVKFQTAVATIGIRGTEFDARLCDADCAAEERARPAPRPLVLPVARVVEMNGVVAAGRAGETVRLLVPGAILNEGDAVATGRNGDAVLVFRDGARVTLAANSRFAINRFRYYEASPLSGNAFMTLYAGNALVTTGQLAKISPDAFLFRTALGVVRPFGTTFGGGGCVAGFCVSGSVTANSDGASASGSASGGGASASGTASAGAGGASASGTASTGSNTVSGSTGTLAPPTTGTAGAPNAQQVMNEVINGVNQVVAQVANTATTQGQNVQQQANNVGVAVQNQVQNTGQAVSEAMVTQAVNALNAATAPIVTQMTALMTQMRNNPPQTNSAAQELSTRMTQLGQLLGTALGQAQAAAGAIAQTDAFRAAYGMALAENLTFHSIVGAGMQGAAAFGGTFVFNQAVYNNEISRILADPYALGSVGLVGLSAGDLIEARNAGALGGGAGVIQREIAAHLATQGSAAAKSFFNEAQSTAAAIQQRTEQEAAAALAAAEAAKAAAEAKLAAARKAAEDKAAADKQRAAEKLAQAKILAEAQARAAGQQAVNAAVAALRAATDPIVSQITALMAQMRNNPPSTEAAFRKSEALMSQLMLQLNTAQEQFMTAHRDLVFSAPVQRVFALSDAVTLGSYGFMQMYSLRAHVQQAEQAGVDGGRISSVISGIDPVDYELKRRELALSLVSLAERRAGMEAIGLSLGELAGIAWIGGTAIDGSTVVTLVQSNVSQAAAAEGDAAFAAFFAEAQAGAVAAQQRAEHQAAAARAAAEAAKAAADAKLAAERKAAEEKAVADKQLAAQKLAAAKQQLEAGVQGQIDGIRSYDITGGQIATIGPPDTVVPPGILRTVPGEPMVTRMGDQVVTTWVETVVAGEVRTAFGGNSMGGTVTRTEVSGPEGTTTTLTFNVMFVSPLAVGLVPTVGGPLFSLGPDKPGTVQVTHRAPDGTTTVSYPGNKDDPKNSTVTVLDGEVEVIGRGRVQKGEMLASSGDKVRLASLADVPDIKVDPDPFKSSDKAVEEGLYVWVRDGAVQVAKDDKSVDVPAGNAAVATKDKITLLDVVPNFLRFDQTPRPAPSGGSTVIDTFRAGDGAIINMCVIR